MNSLKEPDTLIDEYHETTVQVAFWTLQIITYRLDTKFVCIVNNLDPGATICRETGETRKAVQRQALARANEYLSKTVSLEISPTEPDEVQLDRIVEASSNPPVTYTVQEFLQIPIQDRMNFILQGSLTFFGARNELIPSGTAMKLLADLSG